MQLFDSPPDGAAVTPLYGTADVITPRWRQLHLVAIPRTVVRTGQKSSFLRATGSTSSLQYGEGTGAGCFHGASMGVSPLYIESL